MADADVLTELSVRSGVPQCLMLAKKAPIKSLAERFPIYKRLEELASDGDNNVILTP